MSNLHVTEKGRRLEEYSPAQFCKTMNRKIHLSKSQEEKRKSVIYMKKSSN